MQENLQNYFRECGNDDGMSTSEMKRSLLRGANSSISFTVIIFYLNTLVFDQPLYKMCFVVTFK